MKIAGIDFPQPLLDALDTGNLVVFAGAGVSMGPPAGLPDFDGLAREIADVAGHPMPDGTRADLFLDQLQAKNVEVHNLAAEVLVGKDPRPTPLHRNLLRFFRHPDDVRIATTNFDGLFEAASKELFEAVPKSFEGPALPLGRDFEGIVHAHGSITDSRRMVLTYSDFGRAYLTDGEGWARRFARDLFSNWTVLFVGYSHSDPIMTYLTSALPAETQGRLFALVGEHSGDLDHWRQMGIRPISFPQSDGSDFDQLNAAVAALGDHARRGSLGWQQYIGAIAGGLPPIEEESADVIEFALESPERTRFFVQSARDPTWVPWLDARGKLANLFTHEGLTETDVLLSHWLAEQFAVKHDDVLLAALARHGNRVSSELWNRLAWHLGNSEVEGLTAPTLSRWVHVLVNAVPPEVTVFVLMSLAENCAKLGESQSLVRVYELLTATRYQQQPDSARNASLDHQLADGMFWERCLEPHLPEIAHSLLDIAARRLEERHSAHVAWGEGNRNWDLDNWFRSAIEPHDQDDIPYPIHPLVNVARDSLEWMADHRPVLAKAWAERFADSEAPLLRRLAVHAAACSASSGNETTDWLLERCDVNELAIHHEVFRAAAKAYPQADNERRVALIEAVRDYRPPESDDFDEDLLWARHCFDWFHWLSQADPKCPLASEALDKISLQYPDFVPSNHPDFTIWSETTTGTISSPLSADELLSRPAAEWLSQLLEFQPTERERFDGIDRWALLNSVSQAMRTNPSWGLELAQALVTTENWRSDLWPQVLSAWAQEHPSDGELPQLLSILSIREVQQEHTALVMDVLVQLIRHQTRLASDLLAEMDSIARSLRPYARSAAVSEAVASVGGVPRDMGWLFRAINHPAGNLALYWVHRISLWRRLQPEPPPSLDGEFLHELDTVIAGDDVAAGLGRTVLASQFHFLHAVAETWAVERLLPLFDPEHDDFDFAWDGFLTWGRLSPPIAELLRGKLIGALHRIQGNSDETRLTRFIDFYVAAMVWSIKGANDEWITRFFRQADGRATRAFAAQLGRRLRELDGDRQQEWWSHWLGDYWKNRLRNIPRRLDDAEIAVMLEWVLHLTGVFEEAVDVATGMRPVALEYSVILHRVGEREVVELYPDKFADFLVHLGKCETSPLFWHDVKAVIDRLLSRNLSSGAQHGLRELVAKLGLR